MRVQEVERECLRGQGNFRGDVPERGWAPAPPGSSGLGWEHGPFSGKRRGWVPPERSGQGSGRHLKGPGAQERD